MNRLDVYYRALRAYRGVTEDRQCESFRKAFAQADTENDGLTVSKNICVVEEDWMDAIEAGLVFVEKAIREERQFIHSNGEVVPIEKVKHVSKESVQHLARHSNLITKERRGEDMIPDHLYSVEKLNDYAVYENRFLYMLLCYLRDFITIRYEKVLDLSNCYDGALRMKKAVVLPSRKLDCCIELRDKRKNDSVLRESNPAKAAIDRMDLMLKAVLALLATPLMEIAGKAPKLKPPITKTNVLKMDNNFKGAMALYDYIVSYEGAGYTVEERKEELAPFSDALAHDLAEAGGMLAFLTYEYGLGLNDTLKNRFADREDREREEELQRRARKLASLKKKMESGEQPPEEYILELERHLHLLEADNRKLGSLRRRLSDMTEKEERSRLEILSLNEENRGLRDKLTEAEILREKEKEELRTEYEDRIYRSITRHEEEMSELRAEFERQLRENEERHEQERRQLEEKFNAEKEALEKSLLEAEQAHGKEMQLVRERLRESEDALSLTKKERDDLSEQNLICEASIKALRSAGGEVFDENAFTNAEDFNELERELEAFVKFYDERWGIAKKAIRKKLLSYQSLKGRNGRK